MAKYGLGTSDREIGRIGSQRISVKSLPKHAGQWQCPPKVALCLAGLARPAERILQILQLELKLKVLEYTLIF